MVANTKPMIKDIFKEEKKVKRTAIVTFQDGSKMKMVLYLKEKCLSIFPDKNKRIFVQAFNKSQPHLVNKAVSCHILRN